MGSHNVGPTARSTTLAPVFDPLAREIIPEIIPLSHRQVDLHIHGASAPIRAVTNDWSAEGAIIDCGLGGLGLGEPVEVESAAGVRRQAVVRWVGVCPSPERTLQLRVALDFSIPLDAATAAETAFFSGLTGPSVPCEEDYAVYELQTKPRSHAGRLMACLVGLVLGITAVHMLATPPHLHLPWLQSLAKAIASLIQ